MKLRNRPLSLINSNYLYTKVPYNIKGKIQELKGKKPRDDIMETTFKGTPSPPPSGVSQEWSGQNF
jgi:hypothetical protein